MRMDKSAIAKTHLAITFGYGILASYIFVTATQNALEGACHIHKEFVGVFFFFEITAPLVYAFSWFLEYGIPGPDKQPIGLTDLIKYYWSGEALKNRFALINPMHNTNVERSPASIRYWKEVELLFISCRYSIIAYSALYLVIRTVTWCSHCL